MIKKYLNILVAVLCLGLFSCENDASISFRFTDLKLEHAINDSVYPTPTSLDSIPAEGYVLRMNLFPFESYNDGGDLDFEHPPQNTNKPISILVTSNDHFDQNHSAGDTLNDLFLIFNDSYYNTSTLDELEIGGGYNPNYSVQRPYPEHADLLLMKKPNLSEYHSFKVELLMRDSTVFIDSTSIIKLY